MRLEAEDAFEKLGAGSLNLLVEKFGSKVSLLFDAILNDRRICIIGDQSTKVSILSEYCFSLVSLAGEYGIVVLKRIVGYRNIFTDDYLALPGSIYFTTNPMFLEKNKDKFFDCRANIDTGEIYYKPKESYDKEADNFFFRELAFKVQQEYISEFESRKMITSFVDYVLLLISGKFFHTDRKEIKEDVVN